MKVKEIIVTLIAVVSVGCVSPNVTDSFDHAALKYYAQERTFQPFKITGISELSIKGHGIDLETAAPLNPLSIIPREEPTASRVIDALESVGRIGIAAWGLDSVVDNLSSRPTVVEQPKPLVVKPEVIQTR